MNSEGDLLVEQDGNVLNIKLNRPHLLNAFSKEMRKEFLKALSFAKNNSNIRAIMLSGAGSSFCSGGDLKETHYDAIKTHDHLQQTKEIIINMTEIEIPIISVVHGYIAGGGTGLALASDIILAANNSKFFFSFAKIGLMADTGGTFFLPRTIGLYRAKEILFNPRPIDSETMAQWGIVNYLYEEDQLFAEATSYVHQLAKGPTRAIGQMKKVVNQSLICDLNTILEMESTSQSILKTTEDHKRGVRAFIEKKQPDFKNN